MTRSLGIRVAAREAETTRKRLLQRRVLRDDLRVAHIEGEVVFPVIAAQPGADNVDFDFQPRIVRPRDYTDLLPEDMRATAPRAYDTLGDIVIVKIPPGADSTAIGEALLEFNQARAVFHDAGVIGEFRVRNLFLIAGTGTSETVFQENGVRLHVDPAKAYFSPRLAEERRRVASLVQSGERVIDLFAGVGPLAMQLARKGVVVVSVDLNPDACHLARRSRATNRAELEIVNADASIVDLAPADRVVMNLPHGAKHFLDSAVRLLKPEGVIHYHEILRRDAVDARVDELIKEFADLGRTATISTRTVRDYSTDEVHMAFDVVIVSS